jgi:RNA polymerase sigma-70 factor (ECF subfamily)
MTAEEAFDRYHQAVFQFAYRLTMRADVAEDITQECFLALVQAPGRFDASRGPIKTYLFGIARNLVLKELRDSHGETVLEEAPAPVERPGAELASVVAQAVAALPPLQREAVVLFEYEGFTLEEIAEVTGADTNAIKSRLHRARESLKKALRPKERVRDV